MGLFDVNLHPGLFSLDLVEKSMFYPEVRIKKNLPLGMTQDKLVELSKTKKVVDIIIISESNIDIYYLIHEGEYKGECADLINSTLIPKIINHRVLCDAGVVLGDDNKHRIVVACSEVGYHPRKYFKAAKYTRDEFNESKRTKDDVFKLHSWFGYGLGYRCGSDR